MSKLDDYIKINCNNDDYAVCRMNYKGQSVPILLDYEMYKNIKQLNKKWHINDKGSVVTTHKTIFDNREIFGEIYLHDLVLKLCGRDDAKPILHINKLGIDNRKSNLIYDTQDKHITKNLKKKSRTITLPKSSGINPDDIPSYVWYIKEDETHGDRFAIDLGDLKWKSTASKKVSLRYKLEETKKYLRFLKDEMKEFNLFSMNGDLNDEGNALLKSYIAISKDAGYTNISDKLIESKNTDRYLKEDYSNLSDEEIILLKLFDPSARRIDFRV